MNCVVLKHWMYFKYNISVLEIHVLVIKLLLPLTIKSVNEVKLNMSLDLLRKIIWGHVIGRIKWKGRWYWWGGGEDIRGIQVGIQQSENNLP